jgi:hypothetical protein
MIKTPLSTVIGGAFWTPGATVIGGASRTLNQIIKSLFASGEQGFAYDPNDLSTMFQDAAGTIPVTGAGQAVGLMLDKSKGLVLGSQLINNGTFDTDTAWSKGTGWSISGGKARFDGSASFSNLGNTISAPISGKFLKVEFELSNVGTSVTQIRVLVSGALGATVPVNGNGKYSAIVLGGAVPSIGIQTRNASGANYALTLDNVSVREVLGSHAYQTTSSMRPLLVANPQRLDYDTVDDKLTTTLPAQLTGCTVVRSVPNVGTQILTNQTIPTPYNDNKDHCGLIVINRALTAIETSQITKLFNKASGV